MRAADAAPTTSNWRHSTTPNPTRGARVVEDDDRASKRLPTTTWTRGEEPAPRHEEEHEMPPHHEGAQTSDVIGEADIYIAYGRYPQAVSLLLSALDDDPNRSDVRVKLLEVYAETKDEAGFETHMNELLTRCDDNELLLEARELETKLREDGPVAAVAQPTTTKRSPGISTISSSTSMRTTSDEDDGAPTTRTST